MGLMDRHREKERLKVEAAARDLHDHWHSELTGLDARLAMVGDWFGLGPEDPQTAGVLTKGSERVYLVLDGAALIEPRRAPGHFEGRSQGVSLRIMKGVNYRVGAMKGHYVPGPESPTPIDVGRAVITDQRVTFAGPKASREWLFSKLIGCQHDPDHWTVLSVSNRQKASGLGYDAEHADEVIFRLDLAIATASSRRPALLAQLQGQRATLAAQEPPLPVEPAVEAPIEATAERVALTASTTPQPQLPPPGWYVDYTDSTIRRYWDGAAWTEHTAPR
jgi:Protein of unknown function (DUF2510)